MSSPTWRRQLLLLLLLKPAGPDIHILSVTAEFLSAGISTLNPRGTPQANSMPPHAHPWAQQLKWPLRPPSHLLSSSLDCHKPLERTPFLSTGQVPTSGLASKQATARHAIRARPSPARHGRPWVCCGGRLYPWEHLSLGTLLGALLPTFPEAGTLGEDCTAGALPASPFLQDQAASLWGANTPLSWAKFLFSLFPLQTQLRPARRFRQKALYLTKKGVGGRVRKAQCACRKLSFLIIPVKKKNKTKKPTQHKACNFQSPSSGFYNIYKEQTSASKVYGERKRETAPGRHGEVLSSFICEVKNER